LGPWDFPSYKAPFLVDLPAIFWWVKNMWCFEGLIHMWVTKTQESKFFLDQTPSCFISVVKLNSSKSSSFGVESKCCIQNQN
jgi:hypothetical protein